MRLALLDAAACAALPPGGSLILPVGPLAPRGPHLPLSTGVIIAERIARDIAEHLAKRTGAPPVVAHPALPVSPAPLAEGLPGQFGLPADACAAALAAVIRRALDAGFARVMVVAWDAPPDLTRAARRACAALPPNRAFEPMSVFRHRGCPAAEAALREAGLDPVYETWGGAADTSLLLHLEEKLVRGLHAELPPVRIDLAARALAGAVTLAAAGAAAGYVGTPAAATPRLGKRLFKIWRDLFQDTLLDAEAGVAPPDLPMVAKLSLGLL